jgi:hypothetical protein
MTSTHDDDLTLSAGAPWLRQRRRGRRAGDPGYGSAAVGGALEQHAGYSSAAALEHPGYGSAAVGGALEHPGYGSAAVGGALAQPFASCSQSNAWRVNWCSGMT